MGKLTDKSMFGAGTASGSGLPPPAPAPMVKPSADDPDDLSFLKDEIAKEYPRLAPVLKDAVVRRSERHDKAGPGHLEFFPPWEEYNPYPGKVAVEVYDKNLQGEWLKSAVAGDMLHHFGGTNEKGKPNDPRFYEMKQAFFNTITPEQLAIDERAYKRGKAYGDNRSFSEWMDASRLDAYIRGYLFPDKNDEWRKGDTYSGKQKQLLEEMRSYLKKAAD